MSRQSLLRLAIFVLLLLAALSQAAKARVSIYEPFPRGEIGFRTPLIGQTFVIDPGDGFIRAEMWLDGAPVPARWDSTTGRVVYVPPAPLASGPHRVRLIVEFRPALAGYYYEPIETEFDFTVAATALSALPEPDPECLHALSRVNAHRIAGALPELAYDPSLGVAAASHASYVAHHAQADAHVETPGRARFTGVSAADRATYFGYPDRAVGEVVAYKGKAELAVDAWMASLYHRLLLVNPHVSRMGYGHAGDTRVVDVLDCAVDLKRVTERAVVEWPFPGQTGVSTSWNGLESPDPFRLYPGTEGPVGYTVSVTFFPEPVSLSLTSAALTDPAGRQVTTLTFSPANDDRLTDTVALVPAQPLEPYTTYSVAVAGVVDRGGGPETFRRTWSFTTGSGQLEVGPRPWWSWTPSGETVRFSVRGLAVRSGIRLFLGDLPVRDLSISSPTDFSCRVPVGLTAGLSDLLIVTSEGDEYRLGGVELPAGQGVALSGATALLPGGKGSVPALRHVDGPVLVGENAFELIGAAPFRVPEAGRTYWSLDGHVASATQGSAVAWVDGLPVVLPLPVRDIGGVTHVPLELVERLYRAAWLFYDVSGHWAEAAISRLAGMGVVSGYPDGTFRPEARLTRAAFVKMLAKATGTALDPGNDGGFADSGGHWVATQGYLGPAVAAGIVRLEDYPGLRFEPDREITREEIAVMAVRAMGLDNEARARVVPVYGGETELGGRRWADAGSWTQPGHVAVAVSEGIVVGCLEPDGRYTFRPGGLATRAEAATMVVRLLDWSNP